MRQPSPDGNQVNAFRAPMRSFELIPHWKRLTERRPMHERLLVTPKEAAQLLSISRSKTYELIASGKLPSITLGHSRRVPLAELREFIRNSVETNDD